MTIAIILASYNGERYIEEQIRSIVEQRNVELDLYVYDDASNDKTVDLVRRMAAQHSNIFVAVRENPSGSAFRNFNFAIASFDSRAYDYVGFSDQDDIWRREKLDSQVSTLVGNNAVGCSTSVEAFFEDGSRVTIDNAGRQTRLDAYFQGGGQGCTYLMTSQFFREFQDAVRSVDNSALPHDWFAYALARTLGYKWVISPLAMIEYRQHANVFGARSGLKGLLKRFEMLASGNFMVGRIGLTNALRKVISDNDALEELFSVQDHGAKRVIFAIKHCVSLRRSTVHSLLVASMFALGKA
jgi:rhamnosyltransferase